MARLTAALILAAGLGTRFGGRKLLAPVDGKPMLQHVLDLAAANRLAPVVVVLGDDADELETACSWSREVRVRNDAPNEGLARSVRLGLSRLMARDEGECDRVAILLGDQPDLTPEQLALIVGARGQIVVPRFGGVPANPVVLDRSVWGMAAALEGDRGFSQLFSRYPNLVTFVDVPGANPDIDTPADVARESRQSR